MTKYRPDSRDTVIGHDVWLGYGAMVLPGARIGTGAVIGAGAVVRGEVPPYSVVIGNPGTVIRQRVPDHVRDALLALAWWHWPADLVAQAEPALMGADIAGLERLAP
jgi:virginiamycin A acetyltransferase